VEAAEVPLVLEEMLLEVQEEALVVLEQQHQYLAHQ
jgi:hypothetical protein